MISDELPHHIGDGTDFRIRVPFTPLLPMLAHCGICKPKILVLPRKFSVLAGAMSLDVDPRRNNSPIRVTVLMWLCSGLWLYSGLFLLLILDNFVFQTYFFIRWFRYQEQTARILDRPLLRITLRLGLLTMP